MEQRVSTRSRVTASIGAGISLLGLRGDHAPSVSAAPPETGTPPTIVLINFDDLDFRSIAFMLQTLELVGSHGTIFSNFIASQPGCSPSRATLLRGQYPHNHGVLRSGGAYGGFQRFHHLGLESSTLATWLQEAGYRTALIGKYFNEYPVTAEPNYVPPGWDFFLSPVFTEGRLGGVNYINYAVNDNGEVLSFGDDPEEYATDMMARRAAEVISTAANDDAPLFLYLAPRAPHQPSKPAPRHEGTLAGLQAPRTLSFNEEDVSDKPLWLRETEQFTADQVAEIDLQYQHRRETLLAADDLVATVVQALADADELDDAWIFVTSDNGYYLGEHRQFDEKGSPYEEAIRVPLLIRGPGVDAGAIENRIGSMVDLAPTIAELGGAEIPPFVDGRSLLPLFVPGNYPAWRDVVLVQQRDPKPGESGNVAGDGNGPQHPSWTALRFEEEIYLEYSDGEIEWYDLAADPLQLENRADSLDMGHRVRLSARLDQLEHCAGPSCAAIEEPSDPAADVPPLPIILKPSGMAIAQAGTPMVLSGEAWGADGQRLDESALAWTVDITWDNQRATLLPETAGATASVDLPNRPPGKDRGRANYLVEVHLRATAPTGLSREAVTVLQARPIKG